MMQGAYHRKSSTGGPGRFSWMNAWTCCCPLAIIIICLFLPTLMVISSSGTMYLDSFESRKIPVNTYLTYGVQIYDPSSEVNIYRFPSEPPLNQVLNSQYSHDVTLGPNGYTYYSFYLNPGSSANLKFSTDSDSGVTLAVIKGDATMNTFKSKRMAVAYEVQQFACCGYQTTLSYSNGAADDNFYFVLYNSNVYSEAQASISMTLQRTMYDLFGSTLECTAVASCDLMFSHGSTEAVIVQAPDGQSQDQQYVVQYSAYINWPTYLKLFGGLAWFLLIFWCACEAKVRCQTHRHPNTEEIPSHGKVQIQYPINSSLHPISEISERSTESSSLQSSGRKFQYTAGIPSAPPRREREIESDAV